MEKKNSVLVATVIFALICNVFSVGLHVYNKHVKEPREAKLLGYTEMSEELFSSVSDDALYLGNYKIMKNDATGVAYAYFKGSESEVSVKLLNADGTDKMYSPDDENVLTVIGKDGDNIILEDNDTKVSYLVQEDYTEYEVISHT